MEPPQIKIISYSQPPNPGTSSSTPGTTMQDMICYCARVSNPENQALMTTVGDNQTTNKNNERLLNYLIRKEHWSPFEMVSICLEIVTTRDIARQMLRHRSFSFQEFSQRYASVPTTGSNSIVVREARLQDTKNRQNSLQTEDTVLQDTWAEKQRELAEKAHEVYQWALGQGIAKEQARVVLPEGNTPSRLYMNGTLRSWIHYIQLRSKPETQKEHREVAIECGRVISTIFPFIFTH
jgi:thymidylate synthase (FAD)